MVWICMNDQIDIVYGFLKWICRGSIGWENQTSFMTWTLGKFWINVPHVEKGKHQKKNQCHIRKNWQLCLFPKYPDPFKGLTILRIQNTPAMLQVHSPFQLEGPLWVLRVGCTELLSPNLEPPSDVMTTLKSPPATLKCIKGVFGTRCFYHVELNHVEYWGFIFLNCYLCLKIVSCLHFSGKNWWNPGGSWCGVFTLTNKMHKLGSPA